MIAFSGIHRLNGKEHWKVYSLDVHTRTVRRLSRNIVVRRPSSKTVVDFLNPVWSRDRRHLAFVGSQRTIDGKSALFIVEVESGEVEQISNYGKPFSIIGWSSNNLEIMVYRLNEHNEPLLVMYNLHEKKETVYDILPNCWDFAINTDFSTVAYVPEQDNSGIYERKIGSSSSVAVSDRMFYVPRRLSYAPNNKYISFVTYDNSDESMLFNILDLHTDTVQYYQNVPYDFYASWSPNSLYSAYTGVDNAGLALNMVDVEQQKARVLVSVNTGDESGSVKPCNPVWSVEGKRIAIASFENGSFLLYLVDVESSIIKQIILTDPSFELLYDLNWY